MNSSHNSASVVGVAWCVVVGLCATEVCAQTVYDFSTNAGVDRFAYGTYTDSWDEDLEGQRQKCPEACTEVTSIISDAYDRLAYSDATGDDTDPNRYVNPDEGFARESTLIVEFNIAEDPAKVRQIDVFWEGYGDANQHMELYIWDYAVGNWGDGQWSHGNEAFMADGQEVTEFTLSGSVINNVSNYISASGQITLLIYMDSTSEESFHDYVSVTITGPCEGDPDCDDGLFCSGVETCVDGFCLPGNHPCPGQTCDEASDTCAAAQLEAGIVSAGGTPVTVTLTNSYVSPVVVCSAQYDNNTTPVVPRVSNVTSTSFDVRLQNPSGGAVAAENISYIVVEEGVSTISGVKIEAQKYLSTVTDEDSSWVGEAQGYGQSYGSPVVLGQVMTENDSNWSVFWCQGGLRADPPLPEALTTGKTVCEDTIVTRVDETIGFIVFEAGHGAIAGVEFEAFLGADTVQGVDDSPPYSYTFATAFSSAPQTAVTTMGGVDGLGGWAQAHGSTLATATTLFLSIDEDQIGDSERNHTTEQVAYVAFETPFAHSGCVLNSDCDDDNVCTDDVCNTGLCEYTNNTNPCDDGVDCTDATCQSGSCVFSANAAQISVDLDIEAIGSAVTRDVTFVVTTCGESVDTRVIPVAIDALGFASVVLDNIDADAAWIGVSEGHTLRRLAALSFVSCVATVDLTGASWLPAGDFHTGVVSQDNLVDITDFSILAAHWNEPIDPDASTGADATGDGVQGTADFTALQVNFLDAGDPVDACGGGAGTSRIVRVGADRVYPRPTPLARVWVDSLMIPGAERADLNGDGIVDATDIRAFALRHNVRLLPEFDRILAQMDGGKVGRQRR